MDFEVSERAQGVAGAARAVLDEEVLPLEPAFLLGGLGAVAAELAALRASLRERGLSVPHLPREHGGAGLPLADFAHVAEVLGRSPLGHYAFNCQAPDAGNMELLLHHGTPEQQERWLRPLARGEVR